MFLFTNLVSRLSSECTSLASASPERHPEALHDFAQQFEREPRRKLSPLASKSPLTSSRRRRATPPTSCTTGLVGAAPIPANGDGARHADRGHRRQWSRR